jgi:hypothetical protein
MSTSEILIFSIQIGIKYIYNFIIIIVYNNIII